MPMTVKQAIRILTIDVVMKKLYKKGGSIGHVTWEEIEECARVLYSHKREEFDNEAELYAKTWNDLDKADPELRVH